LRSRPGGRGAASWNRRASKSEEGELLIEREILASGKSRAFVGSRP
jgi:hypothetical protein